jgi:hypothetical protein
MLRFRFISNLKLHPPQPGFIKSEFTATSLCTISGPIQFISTAAKPLIKPSYSFATGTQ